MNTQQTGIMTAQQDISSTRIPGMIERLGRSNDTSVNPESEDNMQTALIFTKVNLRPNPFSTSVTLEVTSNQNQQVIVRMMNEDGIIVKLFGWYLLKGTNVTTMSELNSFYSGNYSLSIMGNDGELFYSSTVTKA